MKVASWPPVRSVTVLGGSTTMCKMRGRELGKASMALSSAPTTPHEAIKSKGCSLWLLDAAETAAGMEAKAAPVR